MKHTRRQLIATATAAGAVLAAGGGAAVYFLTRDDDKPGTQVDLLAGMYAGPPENTDPESLAMLSIRGGKPNNVEFDLRTFDLQGNPQPLSTSPSVTLTNLITDEQTDVTATDDDGSVWKLEQSAITSDGWWQIVVNVGDLKGMWTFLMPDPNITSFDTPPEVETDPEALEMLEATLVTLTESTSIRWWEWLSAGNGSIILAQFSVTTEASNGQPDSFENLSIFSGQIPLDGNPPRIRPAFARQVTIGTEGYRIEGEGTPEPSSPTRYLPIAEYDTTYEGHDQVHFGMRADIGGRPCRLVSLHLPGPTEAWFAFWIDEETTELRELFMLSVNHYMHWVYFDRNEPFEITLDA